MLRFRDWVAPAMLVATVLTVAGCLGTVETQVVEPPAAEPSAPSDDSATIAEALAALSAEDRGLAELQRICPVGGGALGLMGTPVKVDLDGKSVFVCCEGCEEPLKKEPAKYLAKLEKVDSLVCHIPLSLRGAL